MMNEQQKNKKLKIVIIVLGILLVISSSALAGRLIYNHFAAAGESSVTVPDNIITPDAESDAPIESEEAELSDGNNSVDDNLSSSEAERFGSDVPASNENETDKVATAIYLYNRNSGDNVPFNAGNMFPGDAETKYFCVHVSYQDSVTVKYHADIRPGYEKLAEVMKCKIVLLNSGEIMYDGLMRDMPASLNYTLSSADGTTDELYYEITSYLDTSVGNEYQNKSLIADFRWWVEEEDRDNLLDSPQTGDDFSPALFFVLMCASLFLLILIFVMRKKEARNEQ